MPDSMVDFSPVLEETADVPEELAVRCRHPMTEQMQAAHRSPLQAFSMNDCQAPCGPLLSAQGWIAFNKSKLQEIFEATLTEMNAGGSSIPDDMELDEKENACVPQPESPVSSVESAQSPSSSSEKNKTEDDVGSAVMPSSPTEPVEESESPAVESRKRKRDSADKDSDRWVALNKNLVFDMIDSAMQQPPEESIKEPEALDLSTKLRQPQVDESTETQKVQEVASSPAEKKAAKRKRSTCPSAKRRRETSNKKKKATKEDKEQKRPIDSTAPRLNSEDDSQLGLTVEASSDSVSKGALQQCSPVKGQRVSVDIDSSAGCSPPVSPCSDRGVSGCRSPVKCSAKPRRLSQESPKHGWVALSKADVHTIVDSVVTSVFLEETAASVSEVDPPAPPVHKTRASGRRVSFASVDQLAKGSPPDSPANEDNAHLNTRPFKWKSNMMMRVQGADQSPPSTPLE